MKRRGIESEVHALTHGTLSIGIILLLYCRVIVLLMRGVKETNSLYTTRSQIVLKDRIYYTLKGRLVVGDKRSL